jgi:tRNA(adenine34) deaminase
VLEWLRASAVMSRRLVPEARRARCWARGDRVCFDWVPLSWVSFEREWRGAGLLDCGMIDFGMASKSAGSADRTAAQAVSARGAAGSDDAVSVVDAVALGDAARMAEVVRFTARTLETGSPVPFGALIVETKSGRPLIKRVNAVRQENDPSSHAEVRTVRAACKRLKSASLKGYTMYSTCEPCPMCMANLLWSGIDRIVYGATIADAARHCRQIYIAAAEVAERSDMACEVVGPVERELAYGLFTHPKMLKVFEAWSSGTAGAGSSERVSKKRVSSKKKAGVR